MWVTERETQNSKVSKHEEKKNTEQIWVKLNKESQDRVEKTKFKGWKKKKKSKQKGISFSHFLIVLYS